LIGGVLSIIEENPYYSQLLLPYYYHHRHDDEFIIMTVSTWLFPSPLPSVIPLPYNHDATTTIIDCKACGHDGMEKRVDDRHSPAR